ncbi:unnamed protein product [Eretmochelys imbricata]
MPASGIPSFGSHGRASGLKAPCSNPADELEVLSHQTVLAEWLVHGQNGAFFSDASNMVPKVAWFGKATGKPAPMNMANIFSNTLPLKCRAVSSVFQCHTGSDLSWGLEALP